MAAANSVKFSFHADANAQATYSSVTVDGESVDVSALLGKAGEYTTTDPAEIDVLNGCSYLTRTTATPETPTTKSAPKSAKVSAA